MNILWSKSRFKISITASLTYSRIELKPFGFPSVLILILPILSLWFPNLILQQENLSLHLVSMFTYLLVYCNYNLMLTVNLSTYQLKLIGLSSSPITFGVSEISTGYMPINTLFIIQFTRPPKGLCVRVKYMFWSP